MWNTFLPLHSRNAVLLIDARVGGERGAVVERQAELLRPLEGEPVADGGVVVLYVRY